MLWGYRGWVYTTQRPKNRDWGETVLDILDFFSLFCSVDDKKNLPCFILQIYVSAPSWENLASES